MTMTTIPRAFPSYNPAINTQVCADPGLVPGQEFIGLDIGASAPCVALHARLTMEGLIELFRCEVAPETGLSAFMASGALSTGQEPGLVCAEAAITNRSPIDMVSPADVLTQAGYAVCPSKASPWWRRAAIDNRLRAGRGPGGLVVDPSCIPVVEALVGYRVAFASMDDWRTSTPRLQHVVDALGYLVEGVARWESAEHVELSGVALDEIA